MKADLIVLGLIALAGLFGLAIVAYAHVDGLLHEITFSIREAQRVIVAGQLNIIQIEGKKMSALSDAVDAVQAHTVKIEADVQAVLALLTQANPDVAAAIAKLQAIATAQATTESELEGAVTPA